MEAFLLETLKGKIWRRDSVVFWTRHSAVDLARRRLNVRSVEAVRILPCMVDIASGETLSKEDAALG